MATEYTDGLPPFVKRAEEVVANMLRVLKSRGFEGDAPSAPGAYRKKVAPEMSPGEKRAYDAAFAALKAYLEIKAIGEAGMNISVNELNELTEEQEQYVYDNPDKLYSVIQANRKAKANADSGDAQTA